MKQLINYTVADDVNELELDKIVQSYENLGYEKIGKVMRREVEGTNVVIYMQAMGQFKEIT